MKARMRRREGERERKETEDYEDRILCSHEAEQLAKVF